MSDSDDTFFDDESFDSVSEVTVEMAQQQQHKIQSANKKLFADEATKKPEQSNVQKWISEQATLVYKRNYEDAPGKPLAQSTPPSSNVKATSVSDTDDQFTSVSQQVSRSQPPRMATIKDQNANSKPLPPPRPPKGEKPVIEAPKPVDKRRKTSTTSVETDSNAVRVEVDDKQHGQTVIRILPSDKHKKGAKPQTAPPKPPEKPPTSVSSSAVESSVPTFTTLSGPASDAHRLITGRRGYADGVFDSASEVGAPSEVSTTSSFMRPIPRKRNRTGLGRTESRRESPRKSALVKTVPPDNDIPSDLSEFESTESDDENPDTAHITARFFIAPSLDSHPAKLRSSQDLFEVEATPVPPTPTIKITMNIPDKAPEEEKKTPLPRVKVFPEIPPVIYDKKPKVPPPKPPPKTFETKPEAPPKTAPRVAPKPEPAARPEPTIKRPSTTSTDEEHKPTPPRMHTIPREDPAPVKATPPLMKPRPEMTAKATPPVMKPVTAAPRKSVVEETPQTKKTKKVIPIQEAPAPAKPQQLSSLVTAEQTSTGSDLTEEEPLPPAKTKRPKPAARKAVTETIPVDEQTTGGEVPIAEIPEEPIPVKEKPKKEKKKKKKPKNTAASKDNTPEKVGNDSFDPLPPDGDTTAPHGVNDSIDTDNTYLQPVSRPTIPIEGLAAPDTGGVTNFRQKRRAKRNQSKTLLDESEELRQTPPPEPGVYQNSPPAKPKVKHSTANKEGVPYAVPDKSGKSSSVSTPLFVKVERSDSTVSADKPPPLPEHPPPQESPYAEISVVDEMINQTHDSHDQAVSDSDTAKRVTIGKKEFIPNNTKRAKDHDHRRVVFTCGAQPDFDIVGGNAEGVFVHNVRPGSAAMAAGLRNGDKLLRVNGRGTAGRTREEVTALISGSRRTFSLTVRERTDVYRTVLEHQGVGDAFCVRAHFTYKAQQQGELSVKPGDIFSVKDTLPNNTAGFWRVVKITAGAREQSSGCILSERRAEQFVMDLRMAQLKSFERQKGGFMKKGFNRSKSLDRVKRGSQEDVSLDTRSAIAYERIEQRKAPFPKPVLLLGLFCDHARDLLAKEQQDKFVVPSEQLEIMPDDPNARMSKEPVKMELLKNICYSGKHCLTIMSPKGIEYLQKTDLNPIVIYLAPGSKAIVKIVKQRFAPNFDRKPAFLWEEAAAFERAQNHMFTGTVPYTENDAWIENLKEMVALLQDQPQWYIVHREFEDDDEEEEEPDVHGSPGGKPPHLQPSAHHGGRLNRSMEQLPGVEETLNLSYRGPLPMEQRGRSRSSGAMLTSEMEPAGRSLPKSILKNKGYSPNTSDSGSNSSFSHQPPGRIGRPMLPSSLPTSIPPRPPQHALSSMLQSPGSPSGPGGFPTRGPGASHPGPGAGLPPRYPSGPLQPAAPISHHCPPGAANPAQAGYHPGAAGGFQPPTQGMHLGMQQASTPTQQQRPAQNMAGFHPAFQQLGAAAMTSHSKETSF